MVRNICSNTVVTKLCLDNQKESLIYLDSENYGAKPKLLHYKAQQAK